MPRRRILLSLQSYAYPASNQACEHPSLLGGATDRSFPFQMLERHQNSPRQSVRLKGSVAFVPWSNHFLDAILLNFILSLFSLMFYLKLLQNNPLLLSITFSLFLPSRYWFHELHGFKLRTSIPHAKTPITPMHSHRKTARACVGSVEHLKGRNLTRIFYQLNLSYLVSWFSWHFLLVITLR